MKNNIAIKLLSIGLLTLTLTVGCTTPGSSSEQPSSNDPISSEVSSEVSSEQVSSEISSEEQSSSETPVKNTYTIKIGDVETTLVEEESGKYTTVLESVTKNTEIKFYLNGKERFPSCTDLGNNLILNSSYDTVVHNDASNVKLTLNVSANGISAFLEGYQQAVISEFKATVNGENATLTNETPGTNEVAKFSITLAINDKLVVLGDGEELYIGENAMHFESEYVAPLPGKYTISVNEYNRIIITEPVLSTEELYLVYVNEELITPTFLTPGNPSDKAEFTFDLKKGDEYRVAYVNGTTLGSGTALYPYTQKVYINAEGSFFGVSENAQITITAKADGEDLALQEKAPGGDLAVFIIEVEANQVIEFFLNGDPLTYKDTSETSFSYEEGGLYKIYVNASLQVWDEAFVPATYREITVTGIEPALLENRNIYTWSWETGKEGMWVEESPKVNEDGSLTVYLPETYDNFLIITTYSDRVASWDNVKSQTNDVAIPVGTTTTTVTWKTKEQISSGGTTPTPETTGVYGLRGSFVGGNDWGTTNLLTKVNDDLYELVVTSETGAEFKVVKVKADDASYVEEWIGDNGDANYTLSAGTYKISFQISTKTVTITAQ